MAERARLALPALALALATACAGARPPPDRVALAAAEGRDADRAMAAAVAAGDLEAFAGHVGLEGIFFGGRGPSAGRAAVATSWAPFFADGGPRLAWAPDRALASPSGDLVLTWGGYAFTPRGGGPAGTGRYLTAWWRDPDGLLRVAFDGADEPLPALPPSVTRRPLRTRVSADGTLQAEAGLLLDGEREVGWYLGFWRLGPGGAEPLSEGGGYRPAAP